jgi:hypothetical protein
MRNFVIYTGIEGKSIFEDFINKELLRMKVRWLRVDKKITEEEQTTLINMVDSPDQGNCEIVDLVIINKEKI